MKRLLICLLLSVAVAVSLSLSLFLSFSPSLQARQTTGIDIFGDAPAIGGKVAPDGATELTCDLPAAEKKKNTGGSDGAGLCVFTSIEYAARWQCERPLFELQKYMTSHPGGGYPEKVDQVVREFAPGVKYGQHVGGDPAVLDAILGSGRIACVTYAGHDPHYGNRSIAHMVCLVHFDQQWACISDNNYPGDNEFVWMSRDEFISRWKDEDGGWAVFLLSPPPPAPPRNWK